VAETRTIAVPEGLAGERLDVVLSRLFGFLVPLLKKSLTQAAQW